jgi:autophagy-related protein 2
VIVNMSWSWYSQLTDSFKRRAGRYLINRYLGPFLEEGILLDQLTVDGSIKLRNVALNTDHINSMLEDTEAPIEFVDGFIQELSVTVPWSNLLKENCFFEIRGLTITCQVKKRTHPSQLSASIFHSMCESFSSKDVAEDCLRQNDITDSPSKNTSNIPASPPTSGDETVLGVEVLAQAIDSIIMRVKVFLYATLTPITCFQIL